MRKLSCYRVRDCYGGEAPWEIEAALPDNGEGGEKGTSSAFATLTGSLLPERSCKASVVPPLAMDDSEATAGKLKRLARAVMV